MWGDVPVAEVKGVWSGALSGYDGADLKAALDACFSAHPDFPPTLPQFRGLCADARRIRAAGSTKINPPGGVPCPPEIKAEIDRLVGRMTAKPAIGMTRIADMTAAAPKLIVHEGGKQ